ncbi:MAG TPA: cation:proton antiporter [Pseudonocardiaceae bacterium]|nr:cation:proton antiporter [Pseudonocardiaceae bacterium]
MADLELARILLALIALLVAAHFVGALFVRLRQPAVIGEILGGVLLGPTVFGALAPDAQRWLFPGEGAAHAGLTLIYQLGLLLLMYLAGTQMRSTAGRHATRTVTVVSVVGMVVPFGIGLVAAGVVDDRPLVGPAGHHLALVLVIAIALAITSIPVISRIMLDLGILGTPFAGIVLSVAVLEDIVLNVVLAIALGLVHREQAGGFGLAAWLGLHSPAATIAYHAVLPVLLFAGAALAARVIGDRPRGPVDSAGTVTRGLTLVLAAAALCAVLGVVPIFGAFVVGLLARRDEVGAETRATHVVREFSLAFPIPVYFALIGLRLDLLYNLAVTLTLAFIVFACVVKAGSVYAGARLSRLPPADSAHLAVALNARGGPGIVLAGVAHDAGIISDAFFTTLVLTAVVTSLLAGAWLERAVARGFLTTDRAAPAPPPHR